jgi:site-specific DNA-methyltransferase (adenine-specific)
MNYQLHHGDCLEVLKTMADNSVDSIVTDPPYGLSFMGKKWDYDVPSVEVWAECLRVLKPGGHLLAFAGTRTQHRMAVRIEDAGFEIRDMIAWVYGSGFPKSLDVSKAIDKAAGAVRSERVDLNWMERYPNGPGGNNSPSSIGRTMNGGSSLKRDVIMTSDPATEAAIQWQGWGTALKPALEPITVARKPLGEKTVAANVLEHGTGAINVDGCRVGTEPSPTFPTRRNAKIFNTGSGGQDVETPLQGRWPANLIHDGSDEVVGLFPQSSAGKTGRATIPSNPIKLQSSHTVNHVGHNDSGSAARFFYCAKASKKDRDEGCEGFSETEMDIGDERPSGGSWERRGRGKTTRSNHHPTVKPTALMRYLCRLVTQPGGVVLDPFMGSGSTGKAAVLEGFEFIGIERDEEYLQIAKARIEREPAQKQLL